MHPIRRWNCWSLRCSWSIACRHWSNYIFIVILIPGFNGLDKDNCKTRQETFKVWYLVHLILELWWYLPFQTFLNTEMAQAVDILPHWKKHTMVVDALLIQGSMASAALVLIWISQNTQASALTWLTISKVQKLLKVPFQLNQVCLCLSCWGHRQRSLHLLQLRKHRSTVKPLI